MAGALLIASPCEVPRASLAADLQLICSRLRPSGIEPRPLRITEIGGVTAALLEPGVTSRLKGASICLGTLLNDDTNWDEPGTPAPDGNFAILRSNAACIELVADAAGSRTIWYVKSPGRFVASTSQRAIAMLLRDFEPNPDVIPWMLSSGTLGPTGGWDARVRRLGPGERLALDRESWRLSIAKPDGAYRPSDRLSAGEHAARLETAVRDACRQPTLDSARWLLPLSGGVDSRGLLGILSERYPIDTVTWGIDGAEHEAGNDARIARSVARRFGVPHRYLRLTTSSEPSETIIERFLAAGEGRVAKISGYTDGFQIWRTLHEEGWDGLVRGDQAFGSIFVADEYEARYAANLMFLSDYFEDRELRAFGLADQKLPPALARQPDETLATWRDRLYLEFRIPTLLAGLTDLKTPYVDVMSPLLSNRVLTVVRELPDSLRTNKRLWRAVVRSQSVRAPYARRPAIQPLQAFLRDGNMLDLMLADLESGHARNVLGPVLCARLRADLLDATSDMARERRWLRPRSLLRRTVPDSVYLAARRWIRRPRKLHPSVLAFRAFIVSRATRLLAADARVPTSPPHPSVDA